MAETSGAASPLYTTRLPDPHGTLVLDRKTAIIRRLYNFGKNLGHGNFGTTYQCTEIATGNEYACKEIWKGKLKTMDDVENVRREIRILHHLSGHQSVVQIKEAYEDFFYVYIVMELCGGGDLHDRIVDSNPCSEKKAAELIRIIVQFVEACHSLGVIHRDLKLENFMFAKKDDDLSLMAIDFGLSVFFKPGQTFTDLVGTLYYIAPEMLSKHYGQEIDVWAAGVILYILLCGEPPFLAKSKQKTYDAILKGHIDFDSEPWPSISETAKNLIKKMLCTSPQDRLSAREVLCHPWIREDGVAPDRALDPVVLCRLKNFSKMKKLKKMALIFIAERFSEEEIAGLKEIFLVMDTNESGTITFDELKEGLRSYGSRLYDAEIQELMDGVDVDKSGAIDYGEFIAATLHLNKLEREEHLRAAFAYFDKDDSGCITVDELQQTCKEQHITDAVVEDIIKEVDQNNDGRIDYFEFVAMMRNGDVGNLGRTKQDCLRIISTGEPEDGKH